MDNISILCTKMTIYPDNIDFNLKCPVFYSKSAILQFHTARCIVSWHSSIFLLHLTFFPSQYYLSSVTLQRLSKIPTDDSLDFRQLLVSKNWTGLVV